MIKAIHIAPTSLVKYVDDNYNKGLNMVLTHLVLEDEEYRKAFKALKGEKYLDNSFFELGYALPPEAILEAAKLVDATVLICPDGTTAGMDMFIKEGYKVMCIPKTPEQFMEFMLNEDINYVGVSEEHIDYRHSAGARYEFFEQYLHDDMPRKKIHLLGATNSIWELGMLSPFSEFIYSWDSSACIWQGHLGNLLRTQQRKECKEVDFKADVKFNLFMESNINFVGELLSL